MEHPKAFISYCHDGQAHADWVQALAEQLTKNGVQITLDQWDLHLGDHLPRFMEDAITDNDFVLIVCTPRYKLRSLGRAGGVGYEGDIIQGEVLIRHNPRKFIPILREGTWEQAAPPALFGKLYVSLRDGDDIQTSFETLLKELHKEQVRRPSVGEKPTWPSIYPLAEEPASPVPKRIHTTSSSAKPFKLDYTVAEPEREQFQGHSKPVVSLAFSPDGSWLASASDDMTVKVWDVQDGQLIRTLTGHSCKVRAVAFSPDGKLLASGSNNGQYQVSVKIWNSSTGREERTLNVGRSSPWVRDEMTELFTSRLRPSENDSMPLAFSPDGSLIATGSDRDSLLVWNVQTGQLLHEKDIGFRVVDLAYSSEARFLASAGQRDSVCLWDPDKMQEKRKLTDDKFVLEKIALSPDGKLVVTAGAKIFDDGALRFEQIISVWESDAGKYLRRLPTKDYINCLSFSPDGRLLIAGCTGRELLVYDVDNGFKQVLAPAISDSVTAIAFSPDGSTMATAVSRLNIKIWNLH